jgi:hypothetical protein
MNTQVQSSEPHNPQQFTYMMLSRLQSDCEYYLGFGNRHPNRLHQGSVDGQIAEMKRLWAQLVAKPEWLTMEQIEMYEYRMKLEIEHPVRIGGEFVTFDRDYTDDMNIYHVLYRVLYHNKHEAVFRMKDLDAGEFVATISFPKFEDGRAYYDKAVKSAMSRQKGH